MNGRVARVSGVEEANNGSDKEFDNDDPDGWRVLPMLVPPWSGVCYNDKGCLVISWGFFMPGDVLYFEGFCVLY